MKKLAGAFYGRLKAYDEAVASLPEEAALTDFLARTAFEERGEGDVAALNDYVVATRGALAGQPLAALLQGDVTWLTP